MLRLETLLLDHNRISKITGIETQKLQVLSLRGNLIDALDYLPVSPKLEELCLEDNRLTQLSHKLFNNTPKIARLNLSKNQLKSIKFVECLGNLEELDVSFNSVESVELDSCFSFMETLTLHHNQIQELPYLANTFPELTHLDMASNYLGNEVSFIQSITNMSSLVSLDFRGNPIYSEGSEDKYVKLFRIEQINGKDVSGPGQKYSSQIKDILEEWKEHPELYLREESLEPEEAEAINNLKRDGFYDEELELELLGARTKRHRSQ